MWRLLVLLWLVGAHGFNKLFLGRFLPKFVRPSRATSPNADVPRRFLELDTPVSLVDDMRSLERMRQEVDAMVSHAESRAEVKGGEGLYGKELTLPLPKSNYFQQWPHSLDFPNTFQEVGVEHTLYSIPAVGVDCEWKPENYFSARRAKREKEEKEEKEQGDLRTRSRKKKRDVFFRYFKNSGLGKALLGLKRDSVIDRNESESESTDTASSASQVTATAESTEGNGESAAESASIESVTSSARKRQRKKSGGTSSPVLLLQISSRTRVWVVDLLVLCRQSKGGAGTLILEQHADTDAGLTVTSADSDTTSTSTSPGRLSDTEQLLDQVLHRLFSSPHVLKLGLGPAADLKRLSWSYPFLPSLRTYSGVMCVQTLAKKVHFSIPANMRKGNLSASGPVSGQKTGGELVLVWL